MALVLRLLQLLVKNNHVLWRRVQATKASKRRFAHVVPAQVRYGSKSYISGWTWWWIGQLFSSSNFFGGKLYPSLTHWQMESQFCLSLFSFQLWAKFANSQQFTIYRRLVHNLKETCQEHPVEPQVNRIESPLNHHVRNQPLSWHHPSGRNKMGDLCYSSWRFRMIWSGLSDPFHHLQVLDVLEVSVV